MESEKTWLRMGIAGAISSAVGIVISGPLALVLVQSLHPQPPWVDAATWAANYHPLQIFPYLGGLPLIAGYLLQAASLHGVAPEKERPKTLLGLVLTGVFLALITFNYITQTTFMPAVAHAYRPQLEAAAFTFSFSNPVSLCWAIEMWGWGVLGFATALWAGGLKRSTLEVVTGDLLLANGVVSGAGIIITVASPGWVMSTAGIAFYAGWNVLVLGAAVLLAIALVRRVRAPAVTTPTLSLTGKLELKLPGI